MSWQAYLEMTKRTNKDDWYKVLREALEIFSGRMVGLAGVPDEKERRESYFREEMKHLLRENINACIKEFQEGVSVSNKTIRVALEFCIRVGAIDHLFGELFERFAEAGMEQKYFENLQAFVLSGKLKQIAVPEVILHRMLDYYYQNDADLYEKSIMNLNMGSFSAALEVLHVCESNFLTSGMLYMLTTMYDKDEEVS